jgi:hypothetical protein
MLQIMKQESEELSSKLAELKQQLNKNSEFSNAASNDVIKTVALSTEISADIKEVLIVLQTTMATEFTETKAASFKENLVILDTIGNAAKLLGNVINKLSEMDRKNTAKTPPSWRFLTEYKKSISIIIVIATVWALAAINATAMSTILSKIPALIKGAL